MYHRHNPYNPYLYTSVCVYTHTLTHTHWYTSYFGCNGYHASYSLQSQCTMERKKTCTCVWSHCIIKTVVYSLEIFFYWSFRCFLLQVIRNIFTRHLHQNSCATSLPSQALYSLLYIQDSWMILLSLSGTLPHVYYNTRRSWKNHWS